MLRIRQISKGFPGVQALDDISIDLAPGEVHALVGENGAGKSTLIKIVCGIYQPDEGAVLLNDEALHMRTYSEALAHGINLVSQEIQVIPKSTVAENIMLDKLDRYTRFGRIQWKRLEADAADSMRMVELDLPATTLVGGLSAAQKQLTMIARALSSDARILILDEPTSALTRRETENLLDLLRRIRARGVTILFVTHKLEEVLALADRVSVLRDGKLIGTEPVAGLTKADIVRMMIGRDARTASLGHLQPDWATPVLEARAICQHGRFDGVDFTLHKGEILGFYGLVGTGRTELAEILIGVAPKQAGEVRINGAPAHIQGMADSLSRYRMGYVSENRKEKGLILGSTIRTNSTITVWPRLANSLGHVNLRAEADTADRYISALEIRATSAMQKVGSLSGGNQQKVSISKWLAAQCDIIIFDEPTIGVDIGAKEYIHQLIWNLAAAEGKSVILISSDMLEIVNVARRILVFKNYQIVGEVRNDGPSMRGYEEVSQEIGAYLT
ncbi:MAG: sugar ABC transporter ATP-binding protein [Caldilineaceae bacterium]